MTSLLIFLSGTAFFGWVSRNALLKPLSHGFYRFFAWECILGLVVLNFPMWHTDPFAPHQPAASISVPLFALIFVLVILGVIIGGIAAWLRQGKHRRVARMHHSHVAALRREIDSLNTKLGDTTDAQSSDRAARLAYRPSSN